MFLGFHRTHIHNTAQSLWIYRASHATLALPPAVQFDYAWGEGGGHASSLCLGGTAWGTASLGLTLGLL